MGINRFNKWVQIYLLNFHKKSAANVSNELKISEPISKIQKVHQGFNKALQNLDDLFTTDEKLEMIFLRIELINNDVVDVNNYLDFFLAKATKEQKTEAYFLFITHSEGMDNFIRTYVKVRDRGGIGPVSVLILYTLH